MKEGRALGSKPNDIADAERALKAVNMRNLGMTYDQIGRSLGYTRSGAWRLVNRHLAAVREETRETAADLFQMELNRLDMIWQQAMVGVGNGNTRAMEVAVRVSERRSKMLGFDDYESRMAAVAERAVTVQEDQAKMAAIAVAHALASVDIPHEKRVEIASKVTLELEGVTAKAEPEE